MIARASVRAAAEDSGRGGGTRLVGLRSQAPLALRATPGALYLVGSAAGPLGGDELHIDVEVGPGATLEVRSVAASVVLPGPVPSRTTVRATVAVGGQLRWLLEPTVAARGCRHQVEARVTVEEGACLVWREELILGRHGEVPGSVESRLTVDLAGAPLVRHHLAAGPDHPAWSSPAVAAGARAVGSVVVVDPAWRRCPPPPALLGPAAAVLPLAGPGVHVVALAPDATSLRATLDAALRALTAAPAAAPACVP